jgi:hypothetical protein
MYSIIFLEKNFRGKELSYAKKALNRNSQNVMGIQEALQVSLGTDIMHNSRTIYPFSILLGGSSFYNLRCNTVESGICLITCLLKDTHFLYLFSILKFMRLLWKC